MFLDLLVWGGVIHMELLPDNSNQIIEKPINYTYYLKILLFTGWNKY